MKYMKAPFLYLGARMGSFMYWEGVKLRRQTVSIDAVVACATFRE